MADDNEFEFPPDQIDSEVAITPEPALGQIPFVILTQTPTDQLPPTRIPGAERRSIRQMLKGALHGYHRKPPFSALADLNLPHLRLSASSDDNNSRSPSALTETQGKINEQFNKISNRETTLSRNNTNSSNDSNITNTAMPSELDETNVNRTEGEINDPHMLHSGVEFDIAQSEHWGPKRAIRSEWSEKQVREFYTALSQYGTDFTAIAVLFKNRTRVDIKRLYNRELRRHPNEVRVALENRTPIDLGVFNKLLKTKRREEAPKHKVLAAEEEQMLKQIASSNQLPTSSSNNKDDNENATDHIYEDEESSNHNKIIDEFAFDEETYRRDLEQVRRQVVKPHRLNTSILHDNNESDLLELRACKRNKVEKNRLRTNHNTATTTNLHYGNDTNCDKNNMEPDTNTGAVMHRVEGLSHSSRESSMNQTRQGRTHSKQKYKIANLEEEESRDQHISLPSRSLSTTSLSPLPRRSDNKDFDICDDHKNYVKDDDETILEMELRREKYLSSPSDQVTLAEVAWAGEFGEINESVNGNVNNNQENDEFSFDGNDDVH